MKNLFKKNRSSNSRSGVATVEMAICLPIFFLFLWANVEVGLGLMAKQVLINAAREGSRACIVGGLSVDETKEIVEGYSSAAGMISNVEISVTPDPTTAALGEPITVSVSAQYSDISIVAPMFFSDESKMTAESTMRKERAN